jgi:hypothetical protein
MELKAIEDGDKTKLQTVREWIARHEVEHRQRELELGWRKAQAERQKEAAK